jgi:hypothetical protein
MLTGIGSVGRGIMSDRLDQARDALQGLLNLLESGTFDTAQVLMRAQRVARLMRDADAQTWLGLELSGYPQDFSYAKLGTCEKYARMGRIGHKGGYWYASLPEQAARLEAIRTAVPAPRTAPASVSDFTAARATSAVLKEMKAEENERIKEVSDAARLHGALLAGLHAYATDMQIALELGETADAIFEDVRVSVDTFVRAAAPKAAEQLVAMSDRLRDGDSESLTAALTSCRRLLQSVADVVFPASDTPFVDSRGKARNVGAEQYKNRLLAYIDGSLSSGSTRAIVEAEVSHLGLRLDAIYEKACKGVHADVTLREVRLMLLQTYLFLGEVARHHEAVTGSPVRDEPAPATVGS